MLILSIHLSLIRHIVIADIFLVSDQLALSSAEIQLPGYRELPD
jgi:hypothetical protein